MKNTLQRMLENYLRYTHVYLCNSFDESENQYEFKEALEYIIKKYLKDFYYESIEKYEGIEISTNQTDYGIFCFTYNPGRFLEDGDRDKLKEIRIDFLNYCIKKEDEINS